MEAGAGSTTLTNSFLTSLNWFRIEPSPYPFDGKDLDAKRSWLLILPKGLFGVVLENVLVEYFLSGLKLKILS